MRLYLDDDTTASLLCRLLLQAGHDVEIPADCGMVGAEDAVHLTHAVLAGRVIMTGNYDDFEELHDLVDAVGGHYPGMLVVRRDNDPRRDLSPRGIVTCLRNLEAAGVPIRDQFVVLNHWR